MPATTSPLPTADARTAEILDSARLAFAEKGFDGASMQDLARAAGMSVGNFYRYFPSKAAIVEALITRDMAEIERDFAAILGSSDPLTALREIIRRHVAQETCAEEGRLWAEITAAALRKPEIGAVTRRMEQGIVGYLCTIFARMSDLPVAEAELRFRGNARLIVMLVKGAAIHGQGDPDSREDLNMRVLRIIDGTLREIANEASRD